MRRNPEDQMTLYNSRGLPPGDIFDLVQMEVVRIGSGEPDLYHTLVFGQKMAVDSKKETGQAKSCELCRLVVAVFCCSRFVLFMLTSIRQS